MEEVAGLEPQLVALAEDEDELRGPESPHGLDHVGVGTELDEEVGLGGPGELGVPGCVVVAAARAAVAGAAEEEVGVALPAVHHEVRLVDRRCGIAHGRGGELGCARVAPEDLDQIGLPLPKSQKPALFVLPALPGGEVELLVLVGGGPLELRGAGTAGAAALGEHPVAPGGEVALEVRHEIARGEAETAVGGVDHDTGALRVGRG